MSNENKNQETPQESGMSNHFGIGLFTDCPSNLQPSGTYRYAMDVVKCDFSLSEKNTLEAQLLTNERSTVQQFDMSSICIDTSIIGNIYVDNYEYVLFVVGKRLVSGVEKKYSGVLLYNFNNNSCIELLHSVAVNGSEDDRLNFHTHYQVQGTFRIRRNGEKVIYWTDMLNPVRTLNIDQRNEYVDSQGKIRVNMLTLMKRYSKIPQLTNVEVLGGGQLPVGTYSIAVRLIDDDLNTTAWITVSRQIVITNTSSNAAIQMTGGRIENDSIIKFSDSSSKIDCDVVGSTIDEDYAYVQFGLLAYNMYDTETALTIYLSPAVAIMRDTNDNIVNCHFSFSTLNGLVSVPSSEIIYKPSAIERAFSLCQVNNRLVLGNVEAAQIKWEKLQKYASSIFTEISVQEVRNVHDVTNKRASFHPLHNTNDVGFQWGEIYSLGIVYVLDNGITSPVYHIPGTKNWDMNTDVTRDAARDIIKLIPESPHNECADFEYQDSNFGKDYRGVDLVGQKLRHHRIPLRTDFNKDNDSAEQGFPIVDMEIDAVPELSEIKNWYINIKTIRTGGGHDFVNAIIPNPTDPTDDEYDIFNFSIYYHINTKNPDGTWTRTFYVKNGEEYFFTREDWNSGRTLKYFLHTSSVEEKPVVDFISEKPRFIANVKKGFFGKNGGVGDNQSARKFRNIVTSSGGNPTDVDIEAYTGPIWYSSSGAVPATYYKAGQEIPQFSAVKSAIETNLYSRRGRIRAYASDNYGFYALEPALAKYPLVESEEAAHCPYHHAMWFSGRVNNCSRFTYMYMNNHAPESTDEDRQAMYIVPHLYRVSGIAGDHWATDGTYQDRSLALLLAKNQIINKTYDEGRYGMPLSHAFLGQYNGKGDGERARSRDVTERILEQYNSDEDKERIGDPKYNRTCLTGAFTAYINGAAIGHSGQTAFQDHIRLAYQEGTSYTFQSVGSYIQNSVDLDWNYPPYNNVIQPDGLPPSWVSRLDPNDSIRSGLEDIVYNVSVINKFCMRASGVSEANRDGGGSGKESAQFFANGRVDYRNTNSDKTYIQALKVTGMTYDLHDIGSGASYHKKLIEPSRTSNWSAETGFLNWGRYWFDRFITVTDGAENEVNMPDITYSIYKPGFNFSNISIPSKEELDGHEVIGYYFVANKRDANNSTILDGVYMLPATKVLSSQPSDNKTIVCGLTNRKEGSSLIKFDNNWIQILSLKNKFLKDMYDSSSGDLEFIPQYKLGIDTTALQGIFNADADHVENHQGITNFTSLNRDPFADPDRIPKNLTEDCFPGTSYARSKNKITSLDKDGFSLYTAYKEIPITKIEKFQADKKVLFSFLDNLYPLEMKDYVDNGVVYNLYNYSQDNNTLIGKVNENISFEAKDELRNQYLYGYLYRAITNPYFNWNELSFYEITPFVPINNQELIVYKGINSFGGDTYISPLKYTNSFFYDNFLKKRAQKSSWMGYLQGSLKAVMGVGKIVAGIYGGGPSMIASGSSDILQGGMSIASDAAMDSAKKKFSYDPDKTNRYVRYLRDRLWAMHINTSTIPDDLIVTISEIINSLWFDSSVNTYWRNSSDVETLYLYPCEQFNDGDYSKYLLNKWTDLSLETEGNRSFSGVAKNELYVYNRDLFLNSLRLHYAIPFTYDDNAKQNEKHPFRLAYSEVSFTEERNDNYRIFLPNNYKDIEGMKGEIRNIMAHNTQLLVFTPRSALVFRPAYEEKVIGTIVSYVGTGSMLAIDPMTIVNSDNGLFGGMTGRFASILLNDTLFYVDEQGRSISVCSLSKGEASISSLSMSMIDKFCKDRLPLKQVYDYFALHGVNYPHIDVPFGKNGVGYMIGYDNYNNRILITKKDKDISGVEEEYIVIDGVYYATSGEAFEDIISNNISNYDGWYIDYATGEVVFYKTEETLIVAKTESHNNPNVTFPDLYRVDVYINNRPNFNSVEINVGSYYPEARSYGENHMYFTDVVAGTVITVTSLYGESFALTGFPAGGIVIGDTVFSIDMPYINIITKPSIDIMNPFGEDLSFLSGFEEYAIDGKDVLTKSFEVGDVINLSYSNPKMKFYIDNIEMTFPYTVNEYTRIVMRDHTKSPIYNVNVYDLNGELESPEGYYYPSGTVLYLVFVKDVITGGYNSGVLIKDGAGAVTYQDIDGSITVSSDIEIHVVNPNNTLTVNSTNNDVVPYANIFYADGENQIMISGIGGLLRLPKDVSTVIKVPKLTYQDFESSVVGWEYDIDNNEYVYEGSLNMDITIDLSNPI